MNADRKTKAEVVAVLNRFKRAVASKDYRASVDLFSHGRDVFISGSEENEVATGPSQLAAFFRRVYARPVSYQFSWRPFSVSKKGNVAWAHVDASVKTTGGGSNSTLPYRMSIVLEKQKKRWLIVHYQGSEPAANRMVA